MLPCCTSHPESLWRFPWDPRGGCSAEDALQAPVSPAAEALGKQRGGFGVGEHEAVQLLRYREEVAVL